MCITAKKRFQEYSTKAKIVLSDPGHPIRQLSGRQIQDRALIGKGAYRNRARGSPVTQLYKKAGGAGKLTGIGKESEIVES